MQGGSGSSSSSSGGGKSRMVHFRTLDWDMDELRPLVVELEFVRFAGGPVVARTVELRDRVQARGGGAESL